MWGDAFIYDESSPTCLRWKISVARTKAGSVAGSKHKKGYFRVRYMYKNYLAHRVVYELVTGEVLGEDQVDHIDGDRSNNTILNLRRVKGVLNSRNQKKFTTNTSGVTGVRYVNMGNLLYAQAYWVEKGIKRFFQVREDSLPDGEAFELAQLVREEAIDLLNLKGYGYTDRHGK